jgi:formyl-CoA transferase
MNGTTKLPLSGLGVIEIGQNLAAPFAASILADLGAEVLKIEKPDGGDDTRGWGPPFWRNGAAMFNYLNRNKSFLTLDLKSEADRGALLERVREADVFIHNLRPGAAETLGLDDATLRAVNPGLIYAGLGAFGTQGPLAGEPAYELLAQAFGGLMSFTGEEGGRPVRNGPSLCDLGTGMWAAIGILAGLARRQAQGIGATVDASLYETAVAWAGIPLANFAVSGEAPRRQGSGHPQISPYRMFETKTGPLIVAAGNDRLFAKFAKVLGMPEMAADPRFLTNADRVTNKPDLMALIAPAMSREPLEVWEARLRAEGVPNARVNGVPEVFRHPQTEALDLLQRPPDGFPMVALPLSFDGRRPPIRRAPPPFGAPRAADST